MGFWGSLFGGGGEKAAPAPLVPMAALPSGPPATPTPSGKPFDRGGTGDLVVGYGTSSISASHLLLAASATMRQVGEFTPPDRVPWIVLLAMAYDPWVHLGEELFAAPLRDPAGYFLEHPDDAIRLEAEAWLTPIAPELLSVGLRAAGWGCAPMILDWYAEDLTIEVPSKTAGADPRNRNLSAHQHVGGIVHDLFPGDIEPTFKSDRLVSIRWDGETYRSSQAFMPIWGRQHGGWHGQGSRRRAYKSWWRGEWESIMQGRWLDSSVDPPRVVTAPLGTVEIDGVPYRASDIAASAIQALQGGGTAVFPPGVEKESKERTWSVTPMQLPDVSDTWHKALTQRAVEKLVASYVPPAAGGVASPSAAGAKAATDPFVTLLRSASEWVARHVLQPVVDAVHEINHGRKYRAPRVAARELPEIKIKRLTEIFRAIALQPRKAGEGKEVTLAELVGVDILKDLNLPTRSESEAAREKAAPAPPGAPGRPRELQGDRETRRENSPTNEGEDDTGGENIDRQERGAMQILELRTQVAEAEARTLRLVSALAERQAGAPSASPATSPEGKVAELEEQLRFALEGKAVMRAKLAELEAKATTEARALATQMADHLAGLAERSVAAAERHAAAALAEAERPADPAPVVQVDVHVPEQPPPVVNNEIKLPEQPPPVVHFHAPPAQPPDRRTTVTRRNDRGEIVETLTETVQPGQAP